MTEVLRQISRYYNLSFDLDSHPNWRIEPVPENILI